MAHLQQENYHIWFDESLVEKANHEMFEIEYWHKQNRVLGQAKGRGITWFVQTQTLPAALRHYRRGGLLSKLIRDSYFFTGFERTRAAKEFALLQYLYQNKVAVPRPIAARAIRFGLSYRADILVEKISDAKDLVAILKYKQLEFQDYQKIGMLVGRMHALQVCHTDLNIHNILQDSQGKFWLIDFDKCSQKTGHDWKKANLLRLHRSFCKEIKRENIFWQEKNWQELLAGYHSIT